MSAEAYVLACVTADLVSAGLDPRVAPTPAREALVRITAGEDAAAVVQAIASDWGTTPSPSSPEPVPAQPAEPRRRVLYTVAGNVPLKREAGR